MAKDIFGDKEARTGAKVITQQEWNDMTTAVTDVDTSGGRRFDYAEVTSGGSEIRPDSFFFPHVAFIDENYTDGLIGWQREEEWYPYIDCLGVERRLETWIFTLDNGEYKKFEGIDTQSTKTGVLFKTALTQAPVKPADVDDQAIVGYQWELEPTVSNVSFNADKSKMTVSFLWEANQDFDADTQASLYTADAGITESEWSTFVKTQGQGTYDGEGLINAWLLAEGSVDYPIDISDSSETILDDWLFDLIIKVPVASYRWNYDQTELERVTQLLIGQNAPSFSASQSASESEDTLLHPFKSRMSTTATDTVEVGYLRPTIKDSINIEDPDTDDIVAVEFALQDDLDLTAQAGYPVDYYVYYDLYKNGSAWEETLKASATWPPTVSVGNVVVQIGFADYDSGSTSYTWYQHQYECPREPIQAIRGEFEPWYSDDGSVTIGAGTVETFNGDSATIAESTHVLSSAKELWVECVSTASAGEPSVVITSSLQTGTYPGMYTSTSDSVKEFNFKIGEIAGGKYIPSHKGRLEIDNTLLQPLIDNDYERLVNAPRMMAFHTNQPTTVGLTANADLIHAEYLDVQVRGGGIQQMVESTKVRIYGKDKDSVFNHIDNMDTTAEDLIRFDRKELDYDFDKGLMQEFVDTDLTPADITALSKWVGIEKGGQIYHKNSPGSSEAWFNTTLNLSGGGTITLYFDNRGHLWKYDTTEQPVLTNYRYRHCSDPVSNPDLVFSSQQANTVILVADECYEEVGVTKADATSPAPTVTNTYSSCSACAADLTQEQWKKCSDDTDAAVLSNTHTDVDYAYLCISSAWTKCYNDSPSAATATNPIVLKQCEVSAPTSCADLVGWPASDDFGGTGCNSGAIGDQNFDFRWTRYDATANVTISGGNIVLSSGASNSNRGRLGANMADIATGKFQIDNITVPDNGSDNMYMTWGLEVASSSYIVSAGRIGGVREIQFDGGNSVSFSGTCSLRARHNGSIWVIEYDTGSGWTNLDNMIDGDLTPTQATRRIHLANFSSSTQQLTIGGFTVLEGVNPAYIDIEGEACT